MADWQQMAEDIKKDPFSYDQWTDYTPVFAMIISEKSERILIGTKPGIAAYLAEKQKGVKGRSLIDTHNFTCQAEISDTGILSKIIKVAETAIIENPVKAIKEQREQRKYESRVQIPFLLDRKYELGHFLLEFEKDPNKEWVYVVEYLDEALKSKKKDAEKKIEAAKEFLRKKWNSKDPVCQYAAITIWRNFCLAREGRAIFKPAAEKLVEAFWQNPNAEPTIERGAISQNNPLLRLPVTRGLVDDELRLWNLEGVEFECVVLNSSFYPLKMYYRRKLNEYHMKLRRCAVCNQFFLTRENHQKTCGDLCAEKRNRQVRREYKEELQNNVEREKLEREANRVKQKWQNNLKKVRKPIPDFPAADLEKLNTGFAKFKELLKKKKAQTLKGNMEASVLMDWLRSEEELVDEIMGQYSDLRRKPEQETSVVHSEDSEDSDKLIDNI